MSDSISIKSPREIEIMREAAKIAAGARSMLTMVAAVGLTGLFMLAVGLAAEAGGRGRNRKRNNSENIGRS